MLSLLFVLMTLTEVERVQAHIAGAEEVLRAADTSALTETQRARRAAVIAELARYRERGEFPRNLDFAERTPYFVDDRGVRCAMAHLIETFGGAALVARVARTANNAYVRELAPDPALRAWLDAHGMTVAEAARVQPSYPQAVGAYCGFSGYVYCVSERCIPALDNPDEVAYCTQPCDPDADDCPTGLLGEQMTCRLVGDEHLCVYPDATPGTTGWSCDPYEQERQCRLECVGDADTREGTCANECPALRCELGLACYGDTPESCPLPIENGGCSTGRGGGGLLALLVCAIFGACSRSRSRSART